MSTFSWLCASSLNHSLSGLQLGIHRSKPEEIDKSNMGDKTISQHTLRQQEMHMVLSSEHIKTKGKKETHMVQHPWALLKIGATARPISFQQTIIRASPWVATPLLAPPYCLSKQLTNSAGVIPSLEWDFTELAKVLAMSKRASASATCSLGFWTGNPI